MKAASAAKVVVCLVALFAFGGVCGFAVSTRQIATRSTRAQMIEHWIEHRIDEDATRLKLTPEQVAQARPLYDQMLADVRKVREEAARGIADAVRKQSRALWPQLTPEQQQELVKLNEERRARWKQPQQ